VQAPAAPAESQYLCTTAAAAPPAPAGEPVVESRPVQPAGTTAAPAAPVPAPAPVPASQPLAQKAAPAAPAVTAAPAAPTGGPTRTVVVLSGKAAEYARQLLHGSDSAREKAAKELKKYNMPGVVTVLVNALQNDGKDDVREESAVSLGSLLARDAMPALHQAAREDSAKDVRKAALKAIKKIEEAYGN
jgi:hypothetical protein